MKKKIKSLDSSNIQYDQLKYNIQVTPSEKEEKIQVSLKFLKETA